MLKMRNSTMKKTFQSIMSLMTKIMTIVDILNVDERLLND